MAPKILMLACLAILAACAKMPEVSLGLSQHLPCSVGPVLLDKDDVLTDGTARQIVALNNTGETLCEWKPPKQ